jgi:predicted nuclease of predicted toxin-antitoxin system
MKLLADESCDFAVVGALREAGHDIASIAEGHAGITDHEVMAVAAREGRTVITEDKDFGQLLFAGERRVVGCVLLRYPSAARSSMGLDVVKLVELLGDRLAGSFVTAEPGRVRLTRLPLAQ